MLIMNTVLLEENLKSFDPAVRRDALEKIVAEHSAGLPVTGTNVNMHFHSFFSYNAEDYSPSQIAWESRKKGLYAAGLCDFDVLDGLEEFVQAGYLLGLRTSVSVETRAYLDEYADVDISSPGEQGVTYIMGAGFARMLKAGTSQAIGLAGYRERARQRNEALINRINSAMSDIAVSYEKDVLPLTPAGAATERHIVKAYINKIKKVFGSPEAITRFLSGLLGKNEDEALVILADMPVLEEAIRSKLVKRGGVGYEQPSRGTFPPVDEFVKWVSSCGAIPMVTWLDGTSKGERDARALLECMSVKGCVALNIIPDRNWRYSDQAKREKMTGNLKAIIEAAGRMNLPVNIGTEMNKLGQLFTDELDCEALSPYKEIFIRGANIMVGHMLLTRFAGFSYVGEKAAAEFNGVKDKNRFFEAAGKMSAMTVDQTKKLEKMGEEKAFAWFCDQVGGI